MSKAYKYRGGRGVLDKDGYSIFERDVTILANNQLYLPTKDGLNDPTEGVYGDDVPCSNFGGISSSPSQFEMNQSPLMQLQRIPKKSLPLHNSRGALNQNKRGTPIPQLKISTPCPCHN